MRLFRAFVAAVCLAATPASAQNPAAFTPREETPDVWPAGAGRDETFYMCTACHATGIITRLGQSRQGWSEVIDQMVQRHNMAPVNEEDRRVLLDYLAANFPPRANPQGGWRNPFAPQ